MNGSKLRSIFQRYGIALVSVGVAVGFSLLWKPFFEDSPPPLLIFALAIMLPAVYGGFAPGIFATILSAFLCAYLFFEPIYSFGIGDTAGKTRLILFTVVGILISILCESLRRARESAELDARRASESEEQFRTMANSIPQLAWIAHADGFIFWYNRRWYDYTGTTPEQMEGWGWQTVHDQQILPAVLEKWRAAIASGEPFDMEFPLRGADGQFRTFLTRVEPLKNSSGAVERWFGTNTDVDELRRVTETLRETQTRLKSALSAGSVGTWNWDIAGDCLVADEYIARIFSVEPEKAAAGSPLEAFLASIVEEDLPRVLKALDHAVEVGDIYEAEYRVRTQDGATRWLQARGQVERDAAGKAVRMPGALFDITESKKNEANLAKLAAIIESSNDAIVSKNFAGVILSWNHAAEKMFGYTEAEIIGQNVEILLPPELLHQEKEITETIRRGEIIQNLETVRVKKDGTRFPVSVSHSPIKNIRGEIVAVSKIALDITDRKRSEEQLKRLNLENERQARALDTILSSIIDYIATFDNQGRCLYMNKILLDLLKKNRADVIGKNFHEIGYPPGLADTMLKQIQIVLNTGESVKDETFYPNARGEIGFFEYIVSPLDRNIEGKINSVVIAGRELTERKRAEAELRENQVFIQRVAETMPSILYIYDFVERRNVFSNSQISNILGYTSHELQEMGESVFKNMMHPDEAALNPQHFERFNHCRDNEIIEREYRLRDRNGGWHWIHAREMVFARTPGNLPKQIIGVGQDITERKEYQQRLETSREQLRALSARLQSAREAESARISREIHDELGQALTGIIIELSWLEEKLFERGEAADLIAKIRTTNRLAAEMVDAVRRIATELRPGLLDDFGLTATVEWQAQEFEKRTGTKCDLRLEADTTDIPRDVSTTVFRILQESLTNVARHAQATKVAIELSRTSDALSLRVSDNGRGAAQVELDAPRSLGVLGMRERALLLGGAVKITGKPGAGTTVEVEIPLPAAPSENLSGVNRYD